MTEPTIDDYIAWLGNPDPDVRRNAAWILGRHRDIRIIDPLIASLDDPELDVRIRVAEALGNVRDPQIVDALCDALANENEGRVRELMIVALGFQGDHAALPALVTALHDDEESVRIAAAQALGQIPDASSIEALVNTLINDKGDVPFHAAKSLANIGGKSTVDALLNVLAGQPDTVTKIHAAEILGNLYDQRAVQPLKALAEDEDEDVNAAAKWALSRLNAR